MHITEEKLKLILEKSGLDNRLIHKFFQMYRKIREGEEYKTKVDKKEIIQLIDILKQYSKKIEDETKKKIGKRD